jgi:exodeoxyribonuclease VII small subunit
MKLFEEGVHLSRECQKQLEEAEGRVEILLKKADGKLAARCLSLKERAIRKVLKFRRQENPLTR